MTRHNVPHFLLLVAFLITIAFACGKDSSTTTGDSWPQKISTDAS